MTPPNQHPRQPDERWDEFLELLQQQKFAAARRVCREQSDADPTEIRWTLGLAWCHLGTGRLGGGLKLAQRVAADDPGNALAFRTIASIYIRLDNLDAALDAAMHAMRLESDRSSRTLVKSIRRQVQVRESARQLVEPTDDGGSPLEVVTVCDVMAAGSSPFDQVIDDPSSVHSLAAEAGSFDAASVTVAERLMSTVPPNAQLGALYGESLFGKWDESVAAGLGGLDERRLMPRASWKLVVGLPVVLAVLGVAYEAVDSILDRHAAQQREQIAERMRHLIHTGAVKQLAEQLADPAADHASFIDTEGAHHATWRRGHATAYRFYDADPARLELLRLMSAAPAIDRQEAVTHALVASRAARPAARAVLALPEGAREKDPQAAYLHATIYRRAGDTAAMRRSMNLAIALEPSNLIHLAEQADIFAWNRWRRSADDLIAEMQDISPSNGWTRVAMARLSVWMKRPLPPEPVVPKGAEPSTALSGVPAAQLALAKTLTSLRSDDTKSAPAALSAAIEHVNAQPAFLLDFVDDALEAGRPVIARAIMGSGGWPQDLPEAWAAEGRVLAVEGGLRQALELLTRAWNGGCRDPRAAETLLGLLAGTQNAEISSTTVLSDLVRLWPERIEYEIRLASALMIEGQTTAAADRLRGRMDAVDKAGSKRLRSQAYLVMARVEASEGKSEEALRLATRAAKFDRNNQEATELARSLVDSLRQADDRSGGSQKKKKKRTRGKRGRR
ncbi:MAG: hypothetical protein V3T05_11850 [Myxococcota bacterium]